MANIDVDYFNTDNDYFRRVPDSNRSYTNTVTINDLHRHSIIMGGFSHVSPDKQGEEFYYHLVEILLKESNNTFFKGYNYSIAESSIKNKFSFYLGMIMCKAIAEKKYNIAYLYHLNDPMLKVKTTGKSPDFFGLNYRRGYLLESKGTVKKYFDKDTIHTAKKQLESVKRVKLTDDTGSRYYTRIRKQIIGTSFESDESLKVVDIDPSEIKKPRTISFNKNWAYFCYYRHLVKRLIQNEVKVKSYEGLNYVIVENENSVIGLLKPIMDELDSYLSLYNRFIDLENDGIYSYQDLDYIVPDYELNGLKKEIETIEEQHKNKIQKFQEKSNNLVSVGLDGTLYIKKDIKS